MTVKVFFECDKCHTRGPITGHFELPHDWKKVDCTLSCGSNVQTHLCFACAKAFFDWVETFKTKGAGDAKRDQG